MKAMPTADGLKNILSGLGGAADKLANTMFIAAAMDRSQLDAAYRGDWIARKGVDIPAFDACREWRSWQADREDITKIEKVEQKFLIQQKVMRTLQRARLYGGGALVIGVDDGRRQDEPLEIERVKEGSLKFVHSVSRFELTAGPVVRDIDSEFFGEPEYYEQTGSNTGTVRFHPSRIVRFIGNQVLDPFATQDGWGDSVLLSVSEAIVGAGLVNNSAAQLVAEAKIDVIKIPGLSANIETQEYEDNLKKRFEASSFAKSVYRTLIMDGDEEWQRVSANFTNLPDIQKLFLLIVSGAFDIPAVRFLSQSPTGLSATGESDIRNYYDRCGTTQKVEIAPAIKRLDDVLLRSSLGPASNEELESKFYIWNSLWQMTESEKAELAYKKAQAHKIDADLGLINETVLKKARENQLIEDGFYPGFEQILEDFDDNPDMVNSSAEGEEDLFGNIEEFVPTSSTENDAARKMTDRARRLQDASSTPRPLYVRRDVLNKSAIIKWAISQGFETIVDDLHVTVIYSKAAVDWLKIGEDWGQDNDGTLVVRPGGPRVIEKFGEDAIVLAFSHSQLQWRHVSAKENGASSDYDDYTPHVTITYNLPEGMDLKKVEPYRGQIVLGPEIFEEIKASFDTDKVTEDTNEETIPQ